MGLFSLTRLAAAVCAALPMALAMAVDVPKIDLPQVNRGTLDYGLKSTPLGGGWHLIAGANADFSQDNGCNIINTGFYVDRDQVVVLNTGTSKRYGQQQRDLIDKFSGHKPVATVLALNLHPDYFLGNQAYPKESLSATKVTQKGILAESKAYEDNLFRLCGDWMSGTETASPTRTVLVDQGLNLGSREVKLLELNGHTASDLVVFDAEHGLMWAGGLVFFNRIPTTPHANLKLWIESLRTLRGLNPRLVVPSHGPVSTGIQAIEQTLDYLTWLDNRLTEAAAAGAEMNDVMKAGAPSRFHHFAAYPAEFYRNVTHLYPAYERSALGGF